MRKFEVVSKVFGAGILTLQGEFGWLFEGNFKGTGYVLSGTWRILSAECPAEWHKEQAGMGMEDREDDYVYNGTTWVKAKPKANPAFLTPSGKWLTIVTDIGEVLGFEIVMGRTVTKVTLPARITPDRIAHLEPGQIFVFGSNYGGRHSKGAALDARRLYGAVYGGSEGLMGQSYGIPTKPHDVRLRLSLKQIDSHVNTFIDYALTRPELTFLVTEIGCGLAGYTPAEIAPLFRRAGLC